MWELRALSAEEAPYFKRASGKSGNLGELVFLARERKQGRMVRSASRSMAGAGAAHGSLSFPADALLTARSLQLRQSLS